MVLDPSSPSHLASGKTECLMGQCALLYLHHSHVKVGDLSQSHSHTSLCGRHYADADLWPYLSPPREW